MADYLNNDDFTFELIVSKGRGKISDKLSNMFWGISSNLIKKPQFCIVDYHDDQILEGYTQQMEAYLKVDIKKYNKTLMPYFTEIAKRSFVKIFNLYKDRTQYNDAPDIISLAAFDGNLY